MRFFFYGTLLDADIRSLVLGPGAGRISVAPATLSGYRRVCLRRRTYPAVVSDARGAVAGCLARGLDSGMADRLNAFEGAEYDPVLCAVTTAGGAAVSAWVYVAGGRAAVTAMPWNLEIWQRRHKAALQRRLRRGAA